MELVKNLADMLHHRFNVLDGLLDLIPCVLAASRDPAINGFQAQDQSRHVLADVIVQVLRDATALVFLDGMGCFAKERHRGSGCPGVLPLAA